MIYVLFVFLALFSAGIVTIVAARKGVMQIGEKFNLYKTSGEAGVVPYKGISMILIIIVCFALALAVQISLYKNTDTVSFIKLFGLYILVLSAAVVDMKRKIIPNILIICGIVFRVLIYVYEFVSGADMKTILINDLIGSLIGFVFLGLVSVISKGALGFGDAKLFGIIGMTAGSFCTYSTLLISLVISLAVSLISIIAKKMDRKASFPFGPCIAAGYVVSVLLTSY